MKIINNTGWDTRNLRTLICEVLRRQDKAEKKKLLKYQKDRLKIEIKNSRIGNIHYAILNGKQIEWNALIFKNGLRKARRLWLYFCYDKNTKKVYNRYNGTAYLNDIKITLRIPPANKIETRNLDLKKLAWIIDHELYHIRGILSHTKMDNWETVPNFKWAEKYKINKNKEA